MSNLESKMFEIFLSDQLFCSLYSALNFMEEKYQAPSPINIWMDSLQIMQEIGNISRARGITKAYSFKRCASPTTDSTWRIVEDLVHGNQKIRTG